METTGGYEAGRADSTEDLPARSASGPASLMPAPRNQPHADVIGRYKLLQPIGEGGFGSVYMAEQHPVKRRVALKLIKPGMDSRQVVARF